MTSRLSGNLAAKKDRQLCCRSFLLVFVFCRNVSGSFPEVGEVAVGVIINIDLLAQLLGSIGNACAVAIVELVNGGALLTAYEADIVGLSHQTGNVTYLEGRLLSLEQ